MKTKNWFEVSRKGLRELQEGKPKHFVARELIQNAWDEAEKEVRFNAAWKDGKATLTVVDDSSEGFRDLADAFTLFASTYKRAEPEKRGRFNIGEKQVLAVADSAVIRTTKGMLVFALEGRSRCTRKTDRGSIIDVTVKMTKAEFNEMLAMVKNYIVPLNISFYVNGEEVTRREPKTFVEPALPTEILTNGIVKSTYRQARVYIYVPKEKAHLYEMGIPVCEIDCDYDLDVQQKVPLSIDRETVSESYLKALYAEVLNETHGELTPDISSATWVRQATESARINHDAVRSVIAQRYGDKAVVANPFDRNSIDDAIANGYRVVHGSEMSALEWDNVKIAAVMPTSTELFGRGVTTAEKIEPSVAMRAVAELAKRIAHHCLDIRIHVAFAAWEGGVGAQYGDRTLTFNVRNLGEGFFAPPLSERVLSLIIHEVAHENGLHTERSYLDTVSKIGARLTMLAIQEPSFFAISEGVDNSLKL